MISFMISGGISGLEVKHDTIVTWKHFLHYWSFGMRIHRGLVSRRANHINHIIFIDDSITMFRYIKHDSTHDTYNNQYSVT